MTLTLIVGACLWLSGFCLALSTNLSKSPEVRSIERGASAVFAICGLGLLLVTWARS